MLDKEAIDWSIYAIFDNSLLPWAKKSSVQAIARALLEGGVGLVQLRDKTSSLRRIFEEAMVLRNMTAQYKVPLIINDRADIVLAVEADGLHIGQDDLPLQVARKILGKERLIGVTVRTLEQAQEAAHQGADYLGVGAIFPTTTKTDTRVVGVELVEELRKIIDLPLIAVGGINLDNLDTVLLAGADGVAIASDLLESEDITSRVKLYRDKIRRLKSCRGS